MLNADGVRHSNFAPRFLQLNNSPIKLQLSRSMKVAHHDPPTGGSGGSKGPDNRSGSRSPETATTYPNSETYRPKPKATSCSRVASQLRAAGSRLCELILRSKASVLEQEKALRHADSFRAASFPYAHTHIDIRTASHLIGASRAEAIFQCQRRITHRGVYICIERESSNEMEIRVPV